MGRRTARGGIGDCAAWIADDLEVAVRGGVLTAVGVIATIAGVIWALQGFGVIGGSFMSGNSVWAIIGPIVAVIGLLITGIGIRRARSAS
jgi:hypothetical protein